MTSSMMIVSFVFVATVCRLASGFVIHSHSTSVVPRLFVAEQEEVYDTGSSWDPQESEEEEDASDAMSIGEDPEEERIHLVVYKSWCQAVHQAITKMKKKQTSLENELRKAQNVEETVARAQLLVSNLYLFPPGVKSARVPDWENGGIELEVTLDPKYETASDEANALFAEARKLKRGSQVVSDLLQETQEALQLLEDAQLDLKAVLDDHNNLNEDTFALLQSRLERNSRRTNFQVPKHPTDENKASSSQQQTRPKRASKPEIGTPASNVRKLVAPVSKCPVLVGRNRRGNEHLSFQIARGQDVWMHARGCPGAHVVLQIRRGGPQPTEQCFQFAANLAAFYSDARNERLVDVTLAEPKHLLKPRNAPLGAVKLRQEYKVLTGRPDNVPESLKRAREESGLTDEYRSADKAKHRKRTKAAQQELQARKKANRKRAKQN